MNDQLFNAAKTHRIGNKVFRISKDTWKECLQKGVTEQDIIYQKKRYGSMGIPVNQQVAALRAIENKLIRSRKGGKEE